MIKKSLKTTRIVWAFILCQALLILPGSVSCEESEYRVTIKGVISNIADVGEYISEQTYLKLYPCETTGKMNVHQEKGQLMTDSGQTEQVFYLDGLNRLVPQSKLPGIGLPVFDRFNFFKVRELVPGRCYKICVMMLDNPYAGMVPLASSSDGLPLEIVLPEAGESENVVVDLSSQPVTIPQPPKP